MSGFYWSFRQPSDAHVDFAPCGNSAGTSPQRAERIATPLLKTLDFSVSNRRKFLQTQNLQECAMQKRLLICDSDRDFANTLASRFASLNVEAVVTTSHVDAAARLAWDDFDMICVDVDVETGQGLALCEFVTWNVDTRNVPIVVLTSRSHPNEIRRICDFRPEFVRKSANCWQDLQSFVLSRWPQLDPAASARRIGSGPSHRARTSTAPARPSELRSS